MKKFLFVLLLLLVGLVLNVSVASATWDASGFENRITYTVNKSMVNGSHSQMPIGFQLNISGLDVNTSVVQVYQPNGIRLAVEKEHYTDPHGLYWIGVLGINDTGDYVFLVYYNNSNGVEPAVDSTYGSEAVYDSNYKAVYHMNNDPTGGSGSIKDSTANDRHGTPSGTFVSGDLVNTNYGKGIDFLTASSQSIALPNGIYSSTYSVEMVVIFDDITLSYQTVYGEGNSGTNSPIFILAPCTTNGKFGVTIRNTAGTYLLQQESTTTHDSDEEITVAWTDASGAGKLFRAGEQDASDFSYAPSATSLNTYRIGAVKRTDLVWILDGVVSEIRLSDVVRSNNFIKTSQKNLNNPTATGADPFYSTISTPEYEAPLLGTFLYPNSIYSVGYYGSLTNELLYETGFNYSDILTFNLLTSGNMEYLSIDDTNYIPSIDKDAAHDGYMYGNFSLPCVESINFITVKTVHNRVHTNPVILGLFNVSTQKWHAVNNSSVETADVELTYNITGTDIVKYTTLENKVLNLSVSLNTNGDENYDVFVDFVEVYIDFEESPDITLEYVYNLTISNQNNISVLQNDVDDLENNVNNLYMFVLLCTVFLVAALRKRGNQ